MDKITVTKPLMPSLKEYENEIKDLFESKWITNCGSKYEKLKWELIKYLKVDNISLFSNGHLALSSVIKMMNLEGEVITTPYTFISTTHAIVENGLTPVFCDIKDDFTIDEKKIEQLITDKTCAIIPVHVYGFPCNVEEIDRIAKKYNLKVIYDAAHCFGVEKNGKSILEYGDASILSFHATKVFNTAEGGAVITKDKFLIEKLEKFKNFGLNLGGEVVQNGINAKMDEFRAALGLCNLKHINNEIKKREVLVKYYTKKMASINGVQLPIYEKYIKYNYAYFPILVENRDLIFQKLEDKKIFCKIYFYPIIPESQYYKNKLDDEVVENALLLANKVLVLPLYSSLSLDIIDNICDVIEKVNKNKKGVKKS